MKTKVHKVVLLIVDHDQLGADEVRTELENVNYPNDCIHPRVMHVETREVDWDDDHPLNSTRKQAAAFEELFK
jgi:hypothetical protein